MGINMRKRAIAAGVLVDVMEMAREVGLIFSTALTAAVWQAIISIPPNAKEDVKDRLEDALRTLKVAMQNPRCPKGILSITPAGWVEQAAKRTD